MCASTAERTRRRLRKWKLLTSPPFICSFIPSCIHLFFFFFIPFFSVPAALKLVKPLLGTHSLTPCSRRATWHNPSTGKALTQNRQENSGKPGYNLALIEPKRFPPGRRAPSYWEKPKDRQRKLHPGKCLCSTLCSLAFLPRKWVIIRLLLTSERAREGGVMERGEILSIIRLWKEPLLA